MKRPSRTADSPRAMWKLPATLFTSIHPATLHPSPGCVAPSGSALSRTHCSEFSATSRVAHPLAVYADTTLAHVLQHCAR